MNDRESIYLIHEFIELTVLFFSSGLLETGESGFNRGARDRRSEVEKCVLSGDGDEVEKDEERLLRDYLNRVPYIKIE